MSEQKLSDEMREYLNRLSEIEPVTHPEVVWPDRVADLEAKLEATEKALMAVGYAHGCEPGGNKAEDELLMCPACFEALQLVPKAAAQEEKE